MTCHFVDASLYDEYPTGFNESGEEEHWDLTEFPLTDLTPILTYLEMIESTDDDSLHPSRNETDVDDEDPDSFVNPTSDVTLPPDVTQTSAEVTTTDIIPVSSTEPNWEGANKTTDTSKTSKKVDEEFYNDHLADKEFPMTFLPKRSMEDNASFSFQITSGML